MGSSDHVDLARRCGIVFGKEIRSVHRSRKEANREEASMLKHLKYHQNKVWEMFFNRSVPGEFPPGSYARKRMAAIGRMPRMPRLPRLHDADLMVGNPSNGKGGTTLGSHHSDEHKEKISVGVSKFWDLVSQYADDRKINRPNLVKMDLGDFNEWKKTKHQNQGASK